MLEGHKIAVRNEITVGIFLKHSKIRVEELASAIHSVNKNFLSKHILSELLKFIPTEDEVDCV